MNDKTNKTPIGSKCCPCYLTKIFYINKYPVFYSIIDLKFNI